MKNSIRQRIKITKTGKILRRPMAIDHNRAGKSSKLKRRKRKTLSLDYPLARLNK